LGLIIISALMFVVHAGVMPLFPILENTSDVLLQIKYTFQTSKHLMLFLYYRGYFKMGLELLYDEM